MQQVDPLEFEFHRPSQSAHRTAATDISRESTPSRPSLWTFCSGRNRSRDRAPIRCWPSTVVLPMTRSVSCTTTADSRAIVHEMNCKSFVSCTFDAAFLLVNFGRSRKETQLSNSIEEVAGMPLRIVVDTGAGGPQLATIYSDAGSQTRQALRSRAEEPRARQDPERAHAPDDARDHTHCPR